MDKVKVVLKNGQAIEVLPQEVEGLKKAGLLKESKVANETKEDKQVSMTKDEKAAMERMYPSKKRPVNIGSHSFKTGKK